MIERFSFFLLLTNSQGAIFACSHSQRMLCVTNWIEAYKMCASNWFCISLYANVRRFNSIHTAMVGTCFCTVCSPLKFILWQNPLVSFSLDFIWFWWSVYQEWKSVFWFSVCFLHHKKKECFSTQFWIERFIFCECGRKLFTHSSSILSSVLNNKWNFKIPVQFQFKCNINIVIILLCFI